MKLVSLDTLTEEIEKRVERIYRNTDCHFNEYDEGRTHELIAMNEFISTISCYEKEVLKDELVEQYRWERDVVISQLAEIGKSFGAKMDDVKEALIKQEPKKVIQHGEEGDDLCWFECPECGFYVTGCWKNEALAYCSECGQAMDWGSEDDY